LASIVFTQLNTTYGSGPHGQFPDCVLPRTPAPQHNSWHFDCIETFNNRHPGLAL